MITEHSAEIDGHLVVWRQSGDAPILWLHGVPDSGALWLPFLERAGGYAPDLPGFGNSGKRADFPYSIEGYGAFLDAFCDHLELDRVTLVAHDWGAVGLAMRPERIERLVLVDVVPFLENFRWHWIARVWRRRLLGEMAMGFAFKPVARRLARGMPPELLDQALAHLDHGTQRAILRLYRSADPSALARAGARLDAIDAPAMVVWGEQDPFIEPAYGRRLAERLRATESVYVSEGGHWSALGYSAAQAGILQFVLQQTQ